MTTHIQDRRGRFLEALGYIQIGRHVQARDGLIVELPYLEILMIKLAGDCCLERRAFRGRIQTQHFMHFPPITVFARVPVLKGLYVGQTIGRQAVGLRLKIPRQHLVAGRVEHRPHY